MALIAGPTASGKSALAISLAEIANGLVINADASQVYADLRVLSARPTAEEEAQVPHRLFGYRDAATACSAADWATDARQAIADAHRNGQLPILVGGTGLYLRTLIDGIAPVPEIDADIRAAVRALPVADAHRALQDEDAAAAARLSPHDSARIARALEVVRSTGSPLSHWQQNKVGGIGGDVRVIGTVLLPPREWLYDRCDRRFAMMLEQGGIEEVRALAARGLDAALPAMRAIGVPSIQAWLAGEIDRDAMVTRGQIATRQYAKRQYTWFGHQPPESWERHKSQLNANMIDNLVIKLHKLTLTD